MPRPRSSLANHSALRVFAVPIHAACPNLQVYPLVKHTLKLKMFILSSTVYSVTGLVGDGSGAGYRRFYSVEVHSSRDDDAAAGLGGGLGCVAMRQVEQFEILNIKLS